ncbi:hypothetical protein MHYP_G00201970 [Metynnis hypsauchen]
MIAVKSPGWNSSKAELERRKMRFAESMTESLRLALWQSGPGHQGFGQQSCRMPPIPKPQLNSALHSPRTRSPAISPPLKATTVAWMCVSGERARMVPNELVLQESDPLHTEDRPKAESHSRSGVIGLGRGGASLRQITTALMAGDMLPAARR